MTNLLRDACDRAARYIDDLATRGVFPGVDARAGLAAFDEPLPVGPTEPADVLELLDRAGSPATVATAGGRYFGFVTGGALPATVAASWLAAAWDQCAGLRPLSPVAETTNRIIAHVQEEHVVGGRDGLAGPHRDAHQRVVLGHDRRRRGAVDRGDSTDARRSVVRSSRGSCGGFSVSTPPSPGACENRFSQAPLHRCRLL